MMQAADLRYGDQLSDPGWHDGAWVAAILGERKMGTRSMVIIEVRSQDAAQMAFRFTAPVGCGYLF
jgi:hypothetical protein